MSEIEANETRTQESEENSQRPNSDSSQNLLDDTQTKKASTSNVEGEQNWSQDSCVRDEDTDVNSSELLIKNSNSGADQNADNQVTPTVSNASEPQVKPECSHDLETLVCGGLTGWAIYRLDKERLDPMIDACEKMALESNLQMKSMQKLKDNAVNSPLTTVLEFAMCPGLPVLHATYSALTES